MFQMTKEEYDSSDSLISALQDIQAALLLGGVQTVSTLYGQDGGYLVRMMAAPADHRNSNRHFLVFFDERGMTVCEVSEEQANTGSWQNDPELEVDGYEYEPDDDIPIVLSHIRAAYVVVSQIVDPSFAEPTQALN